MAVHPLTFGLTPRDRLPSAWGRIGPDDLYVRLAQPADPTGGLVFDRDPDGHRSLGAVIAILTESIETPDNDRAGTLLGTLSL
jgi:hypothetical protein